MAMLCDTLVRGLGLEVVSQSAREAVGHTVRGHDSRVTAPSNHD